MTRSIALIGGRGYVGESFLQLLQHHSSLELAWISSRSLAGRTVQSVYPEVSADLRFESVSAVEISDREADVVVLALPNGMASNYVQAMKYEQKIIDVSADYRFDAGWCYGLPERNRDAIKNSTRVSNPGCYATAVQLALAPILQYLDGVPSAFGVSGYSGAGRTPSPRNDPARLTNNLQPYSLAGHIHELEISHHLGQTVRFMPHVAEFFRGISITISATLRKAVDEEHLLGVFSEHYAKEYLIDVSAEVPEVRNLANTTRFQVGGFSVDKRDSRRISLVACLDNLLKGAASQALQNINLLLGLNECQGLEPQ